MQNFNGSFNCGHSREPPFACADSVRATANTHVFRLPKDHLLAARLRAFLASFVLEGGRQVRVLVHGSEWLIQVLALDTRLAVVDANSCFNATGFKAWRSECTKVDWLLLTKPFLDTSHTWSTNRLHDIGVGVVIIGVPLALETMQSFYHDELAEAALQRFAGTTCCHVPFHSMQVLRRLPESSPELATIPRSISGLVSARDTEPMYPSLSFYDLLLYNRTHFEGGSWANTRVNVFGHHIGGLPMDSSGVSDDATLLNLKYETHAATLRFFTALITPKSSLVQLLGKGLLDVWMAHLMWMQENLHLDIPQPVLMRLAWTLRNLQLRLRCWGTAWKGIRAALNHTIMHLSAASTQPLTGVGVDLAHDPETAFACRRAHQSGGPPSLIFEQSTVGWFLFRLHHHAALG